MQEEAIVGASRHQMHELEYGKFNPQKLEPFWFRLDLEHSTGLQTIPVHKMVFQWALDSPNCNQTLSGKVHGFPDRYMVLKQKRFNTWFMFMGLADLILMIFQFRDIEGATVSIEITFFNFVLIQDRVADIEMDLVRKDNRGRNYLYNQL